MSLSIEKFRLQIEEQEKMVHEKIDPILKLYNENKITEKELVNKLSEAFFELEKIS